MTPTPEKAAPIPAEVLALIERLRSMGQDIRPWGPAYRDRARADMLRAAVLLAEQDRADREACASLPDSREERIKEDEPVMWRRRGKHKWFYRESPPTEQSGTGWLPLYDRARARQGGNNG